MRAKKEQDTQNDIWLKASVVGGLWASMEIIIGSFLHNTRLPFAGSILAFAGTVLLIGFYQLWPQKGLIIRAGFITAIMKSVSPSAIILGPMTGILLEAVLIEFVIRFLGNNWFSVSIAGILSLSSALFHKIFSVIILYGFDIIKVYVNIINFALKQFGISEAEPKQILFALMLVYFVFGILAGLGGLIFGKKAISLREEIPQDVFNKKTVKKEFFEIDENSEPRILLLWIHLLMIPVVLFLFNYKGLMWGASVSFFYIAIAGYHYRKNMRRLKKPVFWSQLIIIVVLSTLFWGDNDFKGLNISEEGFVAGIEMMIRAMFIITAFTALSVELRNRKVKSFLEKAGVGKFYESIQMALGALPQMIALLPTAKEIIKSPGKSMLKPLIYANSWLESFKEK